MELSSEQSQHKHEKDVLLIEQEEPSKENVDDISQIESTHRESQAVGLTEDPPGACPDVNPITNETGVKANVNVTQSQSASTSSSSSREMLNEQAQMLIDEVNAKRKRDTALLGEYKKALEIQASNAYSMVEQNVFVLYERNGKQLQDKLQELFATLDRIAKLELELDQFRVSLGALYKEIH
ncbi:synaptonemal complex central element protein 2-like [Apostichopus japonicus]|uniref:synaptonemal complex central element protein 2-like n=1 Tax=Stichopus japonicus TaxID=307972 RepID=UPI003AB41610